MKKFLLTFITIITLTITGCNKNETTLECTKDNDTTKTIMKNNRITKIINNNEEENVTDEEWETIKNFYEFKDNVTNEEIVNKLKEINEKIGYTCTTK